MAARSSAASTSRSAPARSWASPASRATARTSSSRRSPACASRAAGRSRSAGATSPAARPRQLYEAGLALRPGRSSPLRALILSFPLEDNLVLTSYYRPPFARGLVRQDDGDRRLGEGAHRALRHPDAVADGRRRDAVRRQPAEGGRRPRVQPRAEAARPRPADPRPRRRQHRVHPPPGRSRSATPGAAILLVSAELDEVLELSDRIAVMYRGELVALIDGRTAEREEVGLLMATGGARAGSQRQPRRTAVMTASRPGPTAPSQPARRLAAWPARGRSGRSPRCPLASVFLALVVAGVIILVSSVVTTGSLDLDPAVRGLRRAARRRRSARETAIAEHAPPGHPARPGRAGRRDRLQGGPVQHRRRRASSCSVRSAAAGGRRRAGDRAGPDRDPGGAPRRAWPPGRSGASSRAP